MNTFWEIIKNNPVQLGSLIVGVTTLLAFTWWRQRKEFNYRVISDYPLFDVDKEFTDRVKILFDDKQVGRVSLVVIEFLNNGWQPVKASDFYKPVEVNFGDKAEIMNVETVKKRPNDLTLNVIGLNSSLTIEPTLFNRGDFVQLKVLVHDYKGSIDVTGRIEGIPKIKKMTAILSPPIRIVIFFILGLCAVPMGRAANSTYFAFFNAIFFLSLALFIDYIIRHGNPRTIRTYND
jgi:hypothetical protein